MTHGQGHKANDVFAPRGAWQSGVSADFFALGYDAFGSLLPGRNYSSSSYNYGFNTQLKDDEVYGSTGTSYAAEFWQYDSRAGRRWNCDPVVKRHESPYAAFANNPILTIDPTGADTIRVMSAAINDKGGAYSPGDSRLYLFTVYTEDDFKGEMQYGQFIEKYQMLTDGKAAMVEDGRKANIRSYAKFLEANPSTELLRRAMHVTTVGDINAFTAMAVEEVGGRGSGFSDWEKWTVFDHGEEGDYKDQQANGMFLTYVVGVGVYESDHIGNIVYGSVARQVGQGLGRTFYDGDFLSRGNVDDPLDGYALAMGNLFGQSGVSAITLLSSSFTLSKTVRHDTHTVRTADGPMTRMTLNISYQLNIGDKSLPFSHSFNY